jgi:hypothetical protein
MVAMVGKVGWLSRRFATVRPLREDAVLKPHEAELNLLQRLYPEPVGRLNAVYLEAQLYLAGRDVDTCDEMIRWALSSALPPAESNSQVANMLAKEARRVQGFLDERAEQAGRRRYATSLYWGVAVSGIVLALIAFAAIGTIMLFRSFDGQAGGIPSGTMLALRDVLVCLSGGAAGAVISTIIRVSNAEKLDYKVVTRRTAAFRIVLGWLFAAAVMFLIKGNVVSVFKVPADDSGVESFFYWGGIGFLAGFNEVWARNLVTRSSTPDESGERKSTPTPGLPPHPAAAAAGSS